MARRGRSAWQIIFSSNRSGPWRIWTCKPDGSALRELTHAAADEHDVDPMFSPDGKSILFTSTRGGTTGVWKMSREGGKPERICDGDQAEWSPDGRAIVLRRNEQLFTRELAGGQEKRISPKDWPHCSGPSWSPDGQWIAFACRWDAGNAVFLVPAGGGEPKTVYDKQGACEPHWSPDGKRLVYETEAHLYTIGPDGKKNRPVTWFGGVQRVRPFHPRWEIDPLLPRRIGARPLGALYDPGPGRHAGETDRRRLGHESRREVAVEQAIRPVRCGTDW